MNQYMNLKGLDLPYQVTDTIDKLIEDMRELAAENQRLREALQRMPKALTLQEISQGLSAKGAAPLNLTGLPGK
jgi:hypothetical protein